MECLINHLISKPECGQSQNTNKEMILATGDINRWLNSDNDYILSALSFVTEKERKENFSCADMRNKITYRLMCYTGNLNSSLDVGMYFK